jgi:uncharacterized protein (TIGR03085 family)
VRAGPRAVTRLACCRQAWLPYDLQMSFARDERLALCTLLDDLGPDQPTLCTGWRTADLAAHLVLRERRPDASIGILGGPLAGHTRKVQAAMVARTPFPKLVNLIRTGPPPLSPFRLPGADAQGNLVEYFVHHEDVRRAQPDWQPRQLSQELSQVLWGRLKMARMVLRKAPVGVELAREPGGGNHGTDAGRAEGARLRITAKAKTPVVTVAGEPAELTMWTMGRTGAARVRLDGSETDVAALQAASWRI